MLKKIEALSRWKDHLPISVSLSLIGYSVGTKFSQAEKDWVSLFVITLANILAVSFAFMINEIEDAPDDKIAKKKNPVADGFISKTQAQWIILVVFVFSIALFFSLGARSLLVGSIILILSFLYSFKPVRLKAWPVVDILSHALMLGGLLVLAGYVVGSQSLYLYPVLPIFGAAFFGSAHGQFYNQIRDFNADKKAHLQNTSISISKRKAEGLMHLSLVVTVGLIIYSFWTNLLPIKLLLVGLILAPALALVPVNLPTRDKKSGVKTAKYHGRFSILMVILAFLMLF